MKKIVPFNNVLDFNTDVREITAISLEHNIAKESDLISGSFYISGEYKMTDGEIKREKFDFELPFDIALGNNYDLNTLIVDIDDFRYELIERNKLKVNIDMYIDGETIDIKEPVQLDKDLRTVLEESEFPKPTEEDFYETPIDIQKKDIKVIEENEELEQTLEKEPPVIVEEPINLPIQERISLLDEMMNSNKEEEMKEENINIENNNDNNNENTNIFTGFNEEEKYVTYHVYRVLDNDTLDKILEKYKVTKEELSNYNALEDLKPGDKLIIPANDK